MKKFLYFLPRILAILITAFFAIFIAEGFSPEFSWVDSLVHAIPAAILAVATYVSWKRPLIGGWIFLVPGFLLLVNAFTREQWWISLPLVLPLILVGVLFVVEGFRQKKKAD